MESNGWEMDDLLVFRVFREKMGSREISLESFMYILFYIVKIVKLIVCCLEI